MKIKNTKANIILLMVIIVSIFAGKYAYRKYDKYKVQKFQQKMEMKFIETQKKAAVIPISYWDEKYKNESIKNKYKVVIISHGGGEYSYSEFFKFAAERKGWETKIYYKSSVGYEEEILNFDPDFIMIGEHIGIDLDPRITEHRSKKYALFLSPMKTVSTVYQAYFPYFKVPEAILNFDGVFTAAKEIDVFRAVYEDNKRSFNSINILPLAPDIENEPAEPKILMWYGVAWEKDSRYTDDYKNFIKLLSQNVPMKVYGRYKNYVYINSIYDGYIPSAMDIIEAIRANGIYLLTHSSAHIESATPSLRIFEALAANVVIISDKHPFAIEHFGDNFLYFDQTADPEVMYKQVKEHVDWILSHPKEAKEMANKAHQIFLEKFTLDKDLDRIARMHEYVLRQDKEKGLRYSLVY